jgi:hypothetical protein
MSLKPVALTVAALALGTAIHTTPAAAQPVNCPAMYNQVMALYQSAPASPEYAQMAASYSASCVGGGGYAGPAYSPPYYGYAPAYPDPYYAPGYVYGPPVGVGIGFGFGGRGWHR